MCDVLIQMDDTEAESAKQFNIHLSSDSTFALNNNQQVLLSGDYNIDINSTSMPSQTVILIMDPALHPRQFHKRNTIILHLLRSRSRPKCSTFRLISDVI